MRTQRGVIAMTRLLGSSGGLGYAVFKTMMVQAIPVTCLTEFRPGRCIQFIAA